MLSTLQGVYQGEPAASRPKECALHTGKLQGTFAGWRVGLLGCWCVVVAVVVAVVCAYQQRQRKQRALTHTADVECGLLGARPLIILTQELTLLFSSVPICVLCYVCAVLCAVQYLESNGWSLAACEQVLHTHGSAVGNRGRSLVLR